MKGLETRMLAAAPITTPAPTPDVPTIATVIVIGTAITSITDRRTVVAEHVVMAHLETAATGNNVGSSREIPARFERVPGLAGSAREHPAVEHVSWRPTVWVTETNLRLRPTE